MAVTTQSSTQYTNQTATPVTKAEPIDLAGRVRVALVEFTQSGAGDANSLVNLIKLPAGKVRVIGSMSQLRFSAWGTGTTLDIGWTAHVNRAGTAVAADVDGLDDGIDVSAAGTTALCTDTAATTGDTKEFDSQAGVVIQAKALGAGIPDGATLKGVIAYVQD